MAPPIIARGYSSVTKPGLPAGSAVNPPRSRRRPQRSGSTTDGNDTGADIDFGRNGKSKRTVIAWDAAARAFTVTLGEASGGAAGVVTTPSTFTFTPDPAITNTSLVPVGGFLQGTAVLF